MRLRERSDVLFGTDLRGLRWGDVAA